MGRHQRGGTSTIIRDHLAGFVVDSGVDATGLGRYSWYKLEGEPGHCTYVVTAYAPCGNPSMGDTTYYKQHERFIQTHGLRTNPKTMFREDLLKTLRGWREAGHRVILMMDANEHVLDGCLCTALRGEDLRMHEAVHSVMPGEGPNTHFRGSDPIEGIWYSSDLELISASYLPFDPNLGDHRPGAADFTMESVLGKHLKKIVPPPARRLNSKVKKIRQEYIDRLEKSFRSHKIYDKLLALEAKATYPVSEEVARALEALDVQVTELMLHAEKKCRKLRAGHYEYSPVIAGWLDKCHAYKQLIRLKLGGRDSKINVGNLKRFARRCNIERPLELSRQELGELYRECREQCKRLLAESPWLRKQYLSDKLSNAIAKENEEDAKRLSDIIKQEARAKAWAGVKMCTKPDGVNACTEIDVPQPDGSVAKMLLKEEVEDGIHDEITKRFARADGAPICHGPLYDLLGYCADTDAAEEILEGTFVPPPGTDGPTLIILEEISRIWKKIGDGEVEFTVTQEDYQHYWRRVKERIASSYSGLHFGHYKSTAYSNYLSKVLAKKISIISQTGSAPDRWARGLSVMLEKIAGVAVVTKLRAILLMEADFNFHNKLIFGKRMLDLARAHDLVPEEIYSAKGKTSEDAILHQVLMYDIARQLRRPLLVASVDASQCYDRVAHAIAALTLRAYKVRQSSVMGMLQPIQCMEYYLRTGFGESSSFSGGKHDRKQGLCQGNGAAPPTWQQISTIMIRAQRRLGHGVLVESPISKRRVKQVGVCYVDDNNMWAGLDEDDDAISTLHKGQQSVNRWGLSLISTGGDFQPPKCGVTLADLVPDGKGGWAYADQRPPDADEELDELDPPPAEKFTVPQARAEAAAIQHLKSSEAVEMLGLYARPDGSCERHMQQMRERIEDWTKKIKNGALPTRSVWMSYTHQLWAGLRYGLGASSATLADLRNGLGSADYYLISSLGVVRSITKEWRYLPAAFCGMGLFDLVTETTVATLNSFLQHYGTSSSLGITLLASMEHLQMELGVNECPFNYDYDTWQHLATESWVKALWEKIDNLGIDLELEYEPLKPPREMDRTIMQALVDAGFRGKDLAAINRVRKYTEALFISDLANAAGTQIEQSYLADWHLSEERRLGRHRSRLTFGKEYPLDEDWQVWRKALSSLTVGSSHRLIQPLRRWQAESPRIWRYYWDHENACIECHLDDKVEIYERLQDEVGVRRPYRLVRQEAARAPNGSPATVEVLSDDSLRFVGRGTALYSQQLDPQPATLYELLESWGGEWMWSGLERMEDTEWIAQAMANGTLVCVTDGSYDRRKARDLSGAGYVLYCTATRNKLHGSLVERSEDASSYRGELLGMLAIHLILHAVEQFYHAEGRGNSIYCDNKGAIYTFSKKHKRISAGSKNNDIQRVLRRVQAQMRSSHDHRHVKAHQDDYRRREKLSLAAQLNCECDDLAKAAIIEAVFDDTHGGIAERQTLPLEAARVFIAGHKQTTDLGKALRYHIGRARAKHFYADENIMAEEEFEEVAWDDLGDTIQRKPKMYQLWLGKQGSGFCGTGEMLGRRDKKADITCPNCGKVEDASHLCKCTDKDRRQLLRDSVDALRDWMEDNHTHPEIAHWLPLYILRQGHVKLVDIERADKYHRSLSQAMRRAAHSQDSIGWKHLLEGKVSVSIRRLQEFFLVGCDTMSTIEDWMRGFINKLLEISHSQWIYRNLTKHHASQGKVALKARDDLMREVERQLDLGLANLPPEAHCLLEIDPADLFCRTTEKVQYWLNATLAARKAGERALEISNGKTASWLEVTKDEAYSHLPTTYVAPDETAEQEGSQSKPGKGTKPSQPSPQDNETSTATAATPSNKKAKTEQPTRVQAPPDRPPAPSKAKLSATAADAARRHTKRRAAAARGGIPRQTTATSRRDGLGLTAAYTSTVPKHDRDLVGKTLKVKLPTRPDGSVIDRYFIRREGFQMQFSSFLTLRPSQWLNDEVINYMLSKLINPLHERIHCYSSHFFGRCLKSTQDGIQFDYDEVRRWSARIPGGHGLDGLDELYVPINRGNSHWLFLRVCFQDRRIELFDSMEASPLNSIYLETMLRYLHAEYERNQQGDGLSFAEWAQDWTTVDRTEDSPRQENGDDCGVFTIVSISLLAQGVRLRRSSYDQHLVDTRQIRKRLAHIAWRDRLHPSANPTRLQQWIVSSSTTTNGSAATTALPKKAEHKSPCAKKPTLAKAKRAETRERLRRRRHRDKAKLVLGGIKVKRRVTSADNITTHKDDFQRSRKRSAASIAAAAGATTTSQRPLPPKKRRKGPGPQP